MKPSGRLRPSSTAMAKSGSGGPAFHAGYGPRAWLCAAEGQDRIEAAERERVRYRIPDRRLARGIGDAIERAFGIDFLEIRGRRHGLRLQSKRGGGKLERAGGAEAVAEHAFGR